MSEDIREEVRARYAAAAARGCGPEGEDAGCGPRAEGRGGGEGGCGCAGDHGCGCGADAFGAGLYDPLARRQVPEEALRASLGCGNPTAVADLRPGEVVLDLGSGAGIDVLLSARRVGPTGLAYGLDMTDEMLALARRNAELAGVGNVRFLRGYIEDIPLPAASVDVVISNCVINLSPDKPRVFGEVWRVLRPGGRLGVADVVAADGLAPEERRARGSHVGCIAGALSFAEYREALRAVGFADVELVPTHGVADGMFAAIVRARKPAGPAAPPARRAAGGR
ncbi:MAG TPA: arsenite methyltransferase [Actinomycetota bacterium]|nr:arsenite methyltransferase [Actinomycetota bacterium]